MRDIDKARWPLLSPLLDEFLDLDAAARAARLDALRAQDPELALDLQALLEREQVLDESDFLASPTAALAQQARAGQAVGAYTLVREIGQGGMGTVWLARRTDGRFEGEVAIKFLKSGVLGQGGATRFAREGQILARLAHPHIARLLDAGVLSEGGGPYLVLEYVDGEPIDRYCEARALPLRERVQLFIDVLAAVAHAHNRLILHRDLKPTNILVNQAGEVKLLDFGIAKLLVGDATQPGAMAPTELTQHGGRPFTPMYAAPEQVQGGDVTTATDVYALGVLLYLLLSGQHPIDLHTAQRADTPLERLRALVEVEPRRLSDAVRAQRHAQAARRAAELRGDLDTIVARALKKKPAERYANAEALADELRRWLAHEPIAARPDSASYRIAKFVRRHRWGVVAGGLTVASLCALTALSVVQAQRAERAEQVARQRSAQAEDLLGYMLGDFADKLRPLGRLELLDAVGGKAMTYLAASPTDQVGPQSILQRAKALTVLGEVNVSKRELDAALPPLQAARRLLGDQAPAGADATLVKNWRMAQGAAAFWLGHVQYSQRQFAPARAAFEDYRRYSQALLAQSPNDLDALVELSYAQNSLGTLSLDSGDLPGAERQFRESIALKQRAMQSRPQDLTLRADWVDSCLWLGQVLSWQGEFAQARVAYEQGLSGIAPARAQAPNDLAWLYKEAVIHQSLGYIRQQGSERAPAEAELRLAVGQFEQLLAQQTANKTWWLSQVRVLADLSNLQRAGQADDIDMLRKLLTRFTAPANDSSAATIRHGLPFQVLATLALTRHLTARGLQPEALDRLTQLLPVLADALQQAPEDLRLLSARAQVRLAVADLINDEAEPTGRAQEHAHAQDQCRAVLQELQAARAQLKVHYEITRSWVRAQRCLGKVEQAPAEQAWLQLRDKVGS
jgi:serine/threonine protein kinase